MPLPIPPLISKLEKNTFPSMAILARAISTPFRTRSGSLSDNTTPPSYSARGSLSIDGSNIVLIHRYPDSALISKLSIPTLIDPTRAIPAQITLIGTLNREEHTTVRLLPEKLKWRVEEDAHPGPDQRHLSPAMRAHKRSPFLEKGKAKFTLPSGLQARSPNYIDPALTFDLTYRMAVAGLGRLRLEDQAVPTSFSLVVELKTVEETFENKNWSLINIGQRCMYGAVYQLSMDQEGSSGLWRLTSEHSEELPRYTREAGESPPLYEAGAQ
ncbi:hypothetical protein K432DRAFT_87028 [Lepidopterella palustris CBS 459.81]|uniref:LDB19 N-terminal domain-containing protein n=1 Tax=Lepidopterella palustris CBS 459.81 TaxID=1314670 RepID=A0A8E2JDL4_9PEZI|nr:hypothetical protein K432DRAFT_87028 [Lepidopterella palustris CBS 459.81]